MLTLHILNVYVDKIKKHQFKFTFNHNTLNYLAFIFIASFIAESSATGREDKQTKCYNAEHTFATAG